MSNGSWVHSPSALCWEGSPLFVSSGLLTGFSSLPNRPSDDPLQLTHVAHSGTILLANATGRHLPALYHRADQNAISTRIFISGKPSNAAPWKWILGDQEVARWTSNGSFGIGTSSPIAPFECAVNATFSGHLVQFQTPSDPNKSLSVTWPSESDPPTLLTSRLAISNGISGVVFEGDQLVFQNDSGATKTPSIAANGAYLHFRADETQIDANVRISGILLSGTSNALSIGADHITLGSALINSSNVSEATWSHVQQSHTPALVHTSEGQVKVQSTGSIDFRWDGTTKILFTENGEIFVDGSLSSASDIRLKQNITPIQDPLQRILRLRGYQYSMSGREAVGVLAQEVQQALPQAVQTRSDGYLSVSYDHLVALLIETVHVLEKRIRTLEEAILPDSDKMEDI